MVAGFLVIAGIAAGIGVWYTQEYAYYYDVQAETVGLTSLDGSVEEVPVRDFRGVDADSSPLRYRACFTTDLSLAALTEQFQIAEDAVPRNGPRNFSCYDAVAVGEAMEAGEAIAFVGQRDIHPGFDRMIAIFPDGTAFAWHQPQEE